MKVEELDRAAALLGDTRQGRQAMQDLLLFLCNGAQELDEQRQAAVFALIEGAWGEYGVTAHDVMRDWL